MKTNEKFSETMMFRTSVLLGVATFLIWFLVDAFLHYNLTLSSLLWSLWSGISTGVICLFSMGFADSYLDDFKGGAKDLTTLFLSILASFTIMYVFFSNVYIFPTLLIPIGLGAGIIGEKNLQKYGIFGETGTAFILINALAVNLVFGPKYSLWIIILSALSAAISFWIIKFLLFLYGECQIFFVRTGKIVKRPFRWILDK